MLTLQTSPMCYRALWVVHRVDGAHFDVHPQLTLYAALVIRRRDGLLVTVVDDARRLPVPHDMTEFHRHSADVAVIADQLLTRINHELDTSTVPSGVEEFPGFRRSFEQSST